MSEASCYTVVFEPSAECPSASELRASLEKGSDDVKLETLRKIIVSTINGNPQARPRLTQNSSNNTTANPHDVNHSVCDAFTKQATQKATPLLLGGLSQV